MNSNSTSRPLGWQIRDGILMLTASGDSGLEELDRALAEAQADPGFQPDLAVLFDDRDASRGMTTAAMYRWVNRVADLRRIGFSRRCALVVGGLEPYRVGMARLAAGHLGSRGIYLRVCRDLESAVAALATHGATGT